MYLFRSLFIEKEFIQSRVRELEIWETGIKHRLVAIEWERDRESERERVRERGREGESE